MAIACRCSACHARFNAPDKYAGRRVKCPKCQAPLLVEGGAAGDGSSLSFNSGVEAADPSASSASASGSRPRLRTRPGRAPSAASPPGAHPAPPGPIIQAGDEAARAAGGAHSGHGRRSSGKRKKNDALIVGGIIGVGLLVVAVLGGMLFLGGDDSAPQKSTARHTSRTTVERTTNKLPASGDAMLVIQWPENARKDTAVDIDGVRMDVPASGPVEYELPAGEHRIVLRRRGFEQIEYRFFLRKGETLSQSPKWEKSLIAATLGGSPEGEGPTGGPAGGSNPTGGFGNVPTYADWMQDFDAAQRKAVADEKDVLLAFVGSDWQESSLSLQHQVLFNAAFRTEIDPRFVPVVIDFPRTQVARQRVENLERNQRLAARLGIRQLPVIMLADELGQVYGRTVYHEGGLADVQQAIDAMRDDRTRRDELLAAVERGSGAGKVAAAEEAVKFLDEKHVLVFHGPTWQRWYAWAEENDPQNEAGLHEIFFAALWQSRLADVIRTNESRIPAIVGELDAWRQTRQFKDGERAALLHLIAASVMQELDLEATSRLAAAGLEYRPRKTEIREALGQLKQMAASANLLGTGSGWVVADGGYVLTNHHVVEGGGKLVVRLAGVEEPIPAEVLASDDLRDLALVKVELPAEVKLTPLRISTARVSRGTSVGAFGYPLGDMYGKGLKLTTGIVSATQEQTEDGMILLDLKVNPGNSGGPLCDSSGNVVGVVTAKSRASSDVDSYGMAVAGDDVVVFLKQHLQSFQQPEEALLPDGRREWNEVDAEVSPSVLMLMKVKE